MVLNLRLAKTLWAVTGLLALVAATGGVIDRGIYKNLFPPEFLPGAFPQDILTIAVALTILILSYITDAGSIKAQVVILGLIGSLCYLYGIYTIERVYNWYYLVYAATFACSFWALAYTLSGFRTSSFPHLRLPGWIRILTAIVSLLIGLIFTVLWSASLVPLMRDHNRIEFMYSIYILDLCFIMPAFFITAVMALRKNPFGILVGPAIMILGFFVIFPLGLNELAKPSAGLPMNAGPMVVSFAFAFGMLAVAALQLKMIQLRKSTLSIRQVPVEADAP